MFKILNLLFIAMSLASCIPVTESNKSKLKFVAKDKKEAVEAKAAATEKAAVASNETNIDTKPSVSKINSAELKVAVKKILDANCLSCHGAGKGFQNIANLEPSIEAIEKDPILVSPGDLTKSFIYTQVTIGKMKVYLPNPKDVEIMKAWILTVPKVVAVPVPVVIKPMPDTTPVPDAQDPELKKYSSEIQMANRSYIESVLLQVFDAQGTAAAAYIQTDIFQKIEFGGSCDMYSSSDMGNTKVQFPREQCFNNIGIVQPPNNNPMRYSLSTKVCEKLVADTDRMSAVRKKIYADQKWAAPTDDKVLIAWRLFHQSTDIDADGLSALKDLKNVTTNNDETWKLIILTLCLSPEWQAL